MKMVRSLFLSLALVSTVSLHSNSIVEVDWELPIPNTPFKFIWDKSWDYGFKFDLDPTLGLAPGYLGVFKAKITRKTVGKGLVDLTTSESEFLINECLGKQLPAAYGWSDMAGSTLAGSIAVLLGDQDLRKDLRAFYALKKELVTVETLDEKKEILKQCVILKHSIRKKLQEKKTVDKEVSK